MNIFVLNKDVKQCAIEHCDKHVVKMILETAQILSSVHWVLGGKAPYELTHKNHPCCIWARESRYNYIWLTKLGLELCKEYTYRYGKTHKTETHLKWLHDNIPNLPNNSLTEFRQCMPDQYKTNNSVQAYRNYYIGEKSSFATWKKRSKPNWWKE